MTTGVVVMAYGSPVSPGDLERYYTHIRRGRPPTAELLAELRSRYDAIGGTSPLRRITEAQADRVGQALGPGFVVVAGQKHSPPFIEDGVAVVAEAGADRVIGIVLAPHDSRGSVGEYAGRLVAAAAEHGLEAATVGSWWDLPEWRRFQATAVTEARAELARRTGGNGAAGRVKVLFTAHSLPERVLEGDRYPDELARSAAAIGAEAGLDRWADWGIAWQSAGRTGDEWRGPDILEVITELAATGRADGVVVCPQGFTADGLELLYDLDVAAARRADEVGLGFARTRALNTDPIVLDALAGRLRMA
ncbi:MAG: ferrochelatase [Acidimicrobiia bacterium]